MKIKKCAGGFDASVGFVPSVFSNVAHCKDFKLPGGNLATGPEPTIRSLKEKVFLHTHPSVTAAGVGWGGRRPSQIHSALSSRVFCWHDAPERSPIREITFMQPSHAWTDDFGCCEKAATKPWLVKTVCRARK